MNDFELVMLNLAVLLHFLFLFDFLATPLVILNFVFQPNSIYYCSSLLCCHAVKHFFKCSAPLNFFVVLILYSCLCLPPFLILLPPLFGLCFVCSVFCRSGFRSGTTMPAMNGIQIVFQRTLGRDHFI